MKPKTKLISVSTQHFISMCPISVITGERSWNRGPLSSPVNMQTKPIHLALNKVQLEQKTGVRRLDEAWQAACVSSVWSPSLCLVSVLCFSRVTVPLSDCRDGPAPQLGGEYSRLFADGVQGLWESVSVGLLGGGSPHHLLCVFPHLVSSAQRCGCQTHLGGCGWRLAKPRAEVVRCSLICVLLIPELEVNMLRLCWSIHWLWNHAEIVVNFTANIK